MTPAAPPPGRVAEPNGPRDVSRFEYNLLRILRFFLGHFPADQGLNLLKTAVTAPPCLSASAVRLVEDSLAKGSVLFLTRNGAWRNDRYLRAGKPTAGRVWERVPLEERVLSFSRTALDFLIWATAEKLPDGKAAWDPPARDLTAADELFFFLAFDACRADPDLLETLRRKDVFRHNPLCWLAAPGDFADGNEPAVPSFDPWLQAERAVLLESLQPFLAMRWLRSERGKGQVGEWKRLRQQGRAEYAALHLFLEAVERANRTDLARFVLKTNAALFTTDLTPAFWIGGLQGQGPPRLAERLDTQRAALAVPRQMETLARWQDQASRVSYFDEEYAASQAWKTLWEDAQGDVVAARAQDVIEALEPLRATNTEPT